GAGPHHLLLGGEKVGDHGAERETVLLPALDPLLLRIFAELYPGQHRLGRGARLLGAEHVSRPEQDTPRLTGALVLGDIAAQHLVATPSQAQAESWQGIVEMDGVVLAVGEREPGNGGLGDLHDLFLTVWGSRGEAG